MDSDDDFTDFQIESSHKRKIKDLSSQVDQSKMKRFDDVHTDSKCP